MQEQLRQSRHAGRSALAVVGFALAAAFALASCSTSDERPSPPLEPGSDSSIGGEGGVFDEEPSSAQGGRGEPTRANNRSLRGTACEVKNDCGPGFSCVRGLCQPLSFDIAPTGKECFQIDCTKTQDCCGKLESQVPAKCRSRAAKCLSVLPGCSTKACTRSSDCGGGGVCNGTCSVSGGRCTSNVDCLTNRCIDGNCSLNFTTCTSDAECAINSCIGGTCDCSNPTFDRADPVCSDPDCEDLCLWVCEDSRCVLPTSCRSNDDCFGATPLCVDGTCAECADALDCSFDKVCREGRCETPCQSDFHCGLFEACHAGECLYVGCRSDRECSLIPSLESIGFSPGIDRRLLRCNTNEEGIGECLIPCQTDAQCPPTEVCSGGRCQYIGCESDAECKTILKVHNQFASSERPWVSRVECR